MDKQIVVYPHDRILDSNKKKRTIDTQNNMDEFPNNYAEQTSKKGYIL